LEVGDTAGLEACATGLASSPALEPMKYAGWEGAPTEVTRLAAGHFLAFGMAKSDERFFDLFPENQLTNRKCPCIYNVTTLHGR
jgi:hypothetical protein